MLELARRHTQALQQWLRERDQPPVLLTDEDSIAYYGGVWGYLGMEFGRPTLMLIPPDTDPVILTPSMESEMVQRMTWVDDVRSWEDSGGGRYWHNRLDDLMREYGVERLAIEDAVTPVTVLRRLERVIGPDHLLDIRGQLRDQRMTKTDDELEIMRQAGQIAIAMVEAGKAALEPGVPEYEVALAIIDAGTRTAASLLSDEGWDSFVSPVAHNLQVLHSGADTCMVHRRSNTRRLARFDPVYMCFCGFVEFKHYRLGFDREFFVGDVRDEDARVYEATLAAQQAALEEIRPGVLAEDVNAAATRVYREHGFAPGYRTGRSIGIANLEAPELKDGDRTPLRAGMTFAVDGGITIPGRFGGRVGDSIVVTDDGFRYLTPYPRQLTVV